MEIAELEKLFIANGFQLADKDVKPFRPYASEPWYSQLVQKNGYSFRSRRNGSKILGSGNLYRLAIPMFGAFPTVGKIRFQYLFAYYTSTTDLVHYAATGLPLFSLPDISLKDLKKTLKAFDGYQEFCPYCQTPMTYRLKQRAIEANWFWSCTFYPHCNGTRRRNDNQPVSLPEKN